MNHLGIVVGHNFDNRGAKATYPLNTYEYDYNSGVAEKVYIEARSRGMDVTIVHKNGLLTKDVGEIVSACADCAIELHFNAFNGSAKGSETFYAFESIQSKSFADIVHPHIARCFDRSGKTDRGAKPLKESDRGFYNLSAIKGPAIIVEPAFGDNCSDSALLKDKEIEYARCLVDAVEEWFKAKEEKCQEPME